MSWSSVVMGFSYTSIIYLQKVYKRSYVCAVEKWDKTPISSFAGTYSIITENIYKNVHTSICMVSICLNIYNQLDFTI